jgi:hypothetical protein
MSLKRFMSLLHVWNKPCTYLASRLALSLNGPKRAFIWPTSPCGPSGVAKKISVPVVHSRKPCNYLAPRLTPSPKGQKRASTSPTSPRSSIGLAQNDLWAYCTFRANRAPILRRDYHYLWTDRNELLFDPRHLGDPSGVAKKNFHARDKFGKNCAPILGRD